MCARVNELFIWAFSIFFCFILIIHHPSRLHHDCDHNLLLLRVLRHRHRQRASMSHRITRDHPGCFARLIHFCCASAPTPFSGSKHLHKTKRIKTHAHTYNSRNLHTYNAQPCHGGTAQGKGRRLSITGSCRPRARKRTKTTVPFPVFHFSSGHFFIFSLLSCVSGWFRVIP